MQLQSFFFIFFLIISTAAFAKTNEPIQQDKKSQQTNSKVQVIERKDKISEPLLTGQPIAKPLKPAGSTVDSAIDKDGDLGQPKGE